jgi:hypothetical protein
MIAAELLTYGDTCQGNISCFWKLMFLIDVFEDTIRHRRPSVKEVANPWV